jgi:hypothetical protein
MVVPENTWANNVNIIETEGRYIVINIAKYCIILRKSIHRTIKIKGPKKDIKRCILDTCNAVLVPSGA